MDHPFSSIDNRASKNSWKINTFPELEVEQNYLFEAISILLHTILFTRSPGPVCPVEESSSILGIAYAKCGAYDVDQQVYIAVQNLRRVVTPIGSNLSKGSIILTFFERKLKKALFGLMSNEEKDIWEQWVIPIIIKSTDNQGNIHKPYSDETISTELDDNNSNKPNPIELDDKNSHKMRTEKTLRNLLHHILQFVQVVDHIPSVMYEFEISVSGGKLAEGSTMSKYGQIHQDSPMEYSV